nr:MAG TPA: hypothetical protein [Caudoviricetes sp.]
MLLLSYKINKAVTPTKNEPPPIKKRKVSRLYRNRRNGTRL